MNIQKIVVGVDGTAPSRAAVHWACNEAAATGAALVLAQVLDDDWVTISSRMLDELRADSARLIEHEREYARGVAPSLQIGTQVLRGRAMTELARLSDDTTLIVVGTHKSGFHYGRASGSRSLQLANLTTGPIAVVPESAVRFRSGIVVGVDPSPAGLGAIDFAAEEAARRGTELTLVRASTVPLPLGFGDDERQDWEARTDQSARKTLASAVERARKACPTATIRSRVVRRPAGAALNELARTAEMLVIGDSRRNGPRGTLGSVAYDVLLNLTSPTIVVPGPPVRPADGSQGDAGSKEGHHALR
jgi:Universal stress protein UspA and related nucleotide-binding proteins